ncbi:hypothetical protein FISHEDRAFT_44377 [Fistulina hepatica ATCC 64428]|uniref:RING-type domain-containing protein n=1 Tax=Fistulina hepatica ATCC 64428 TaxID=1128425 RepID=A0A0D7AB18_9AGAR|nr:hypothetical protein FISHEDRAFT_44377 [Fistulina hepatica ATCC 64428]
MSIPPVEANLDVRAHDLPESVDDLFQACITLAEAERAAIEARLVVVPVAHTEADVVCTLRVQVQVYLLPTIFEPPARSLEDAQRRVLYHIFPLSQASARPSTGGATDIPFFFSVVGPAPATDVASAMQPADLLPTLLPFQRRSVAWLLRREGFVFPSNDRKAVLCRIPISTFSFWSPVPVGYMHSLTGALVRNLADLNGEEDEATTADISGAILAEEPGLGKTLETIAVIMLTRPFASTRDPRGTPRWDPQTKLQVHVVKSTLVVTPPALASQWVEELRTHAPTLRVLVYDGWQKVEIPLNNSSAERDRVKRLKSRTSSLLKKRKLAKALKANSDDEDVDVQPPAPTLEDWSTYVHEYDVVITTYRVLQQDLFVARPPPSRPRRADVVYTSLDRARSPLVSVEWDRVVMDEVQMVGGGKAADMVSLIPRRASLAVSGTPAKTQVSDLLHVLRFLRVEDVMGSTKLWTRLLKPAFAQHFAAFMNEYTIRTMKSAIQDELTIPQQTRYLVGIEMGPIERHVYDEALERVLLDLGLDSRGVASVEGWEPDANLLRSSIRRLRAICTHPQVGQLQHERMTRTVLKSMSEVLEGMRDQNWRDIMDDFKLHVQAQIRLAQLHMLDEANVKRYQKSLELLEAAGKDVENLCREVEDALLVLNDNNDASITANKCAETESVDAKGKGRGREVDDDRSDDEISSDYGGQESLAETHMRIKKQALQSRLRECRMVLHRVWFLKGDIFHMLGNTDAENQAYANAQQIRHNLLKATAADAMRAMAELAHHWVSGQAPLIQTPYLPESSSRTDELTREGNSIIENVLNAQSRLLWEWRAHIKELLTLPLGSEDDQEADGMEFQRSLDTQGEAETYLQVYAALLADRKQALINERTLLAAHAIKEKKKRTTKTAAEAVDEIPDEVREAIDLQLEHTILQQMLTVRRKALLEGLNQRALKSVRNDLIAAGAKLDKKSPEKKEIEDIVKSLKELMMEQNRVGEKLDSDIALLRRAFNQRILYFRQLQQISDTVEELKYELTLENALADTRLELAELDAKIKTNRARQRYLQQIDRRDESDEDEDCCILCRCEFKRGFMTQCAHMFCEDCMKLWILKKAGKTCPVCRVGIDPDTMQRFTVEEKNPVESSKPANTEPVPKSRREIDYNFIDPRVLAEIRDIDTLGDYGQKIQTLIRHLLYLQITDAGAKSIVFSAWADSLTILQRALTENGILCVRIDRASKGKSAVQRFKEQDEISVLLLHGERENAGLNITCASRVFLLESVVHHGFEIQAIARIDRMGQTRPTEVYCYYAQDTIEKNILDLAARRGLSLYTRENYRGTVNVSSFAADAQKTVESPRKNKVKGDFIFKVDDMLAVLFPHMYEEVQYLVEDAAMTIDEPAEISVNGVITSGSKQGWQAWPNAVAGPSSLLA